MTSNGIVPLCSNQTVIFEILLHHFQSDKVCFSVDDVFLTLDSTLGVVDPSKQILVTELMQVKRKLSHKLSTIDDIKECLGTSLRPWTIFKN